MRLNSKNLLLYAVTDRRWLNGKSLAEQVEQSIKGGVTCVQLREKNMSDEEFLKEAFEIGEVCKRYGVLFIVNDNVEVAVKCGADGIHVGQRDMNAGELRRRVGEEMIIGVSASTVQEAVEAQENGADYIGAGAVFPTSTKDDANAVDRNMLREICSSVDIPVVAIGGITAENISQLSGTGIAGVAVVSAIFAQADIEKASDELIRSIRKVC